MPNAPIENKVDVGAVSSQYKFDALSALVKSRCIAFVHPLSELPTNHTSLDDKSFIIIISGADPNPCATVAPWTPFPTYLTIENPAAWFALAIDCIVPSVRIEGIGFAFHAQ